MPLHYPGPCVSDLLAALPAAWRAVRGNQGSRTPGIDGVTRAAVIERIGVDPFLHGIQRALENGTYTFWPPRVVQVPKASGRVRRICIPTLRDRVVQMAMKIALETIFEPVFLPVSYGYRPGLGPHAAVHAVIAALETAGGPARVITADVATFFDSIDHALLLEQAAARVSDPRMLALLGRFLEAGAVPDGHHRASSIGVPQGSPLSPLLGNLVLHDLDTQVVACGTANGVADGETPVFYARYADDLTVLVPGRKHDAEDVLRNIRGLLALLPESDGRA